MKTYKDQKKRHYLFDWDNNILHMNTKIRLDQLIDGEWIDIYLTSEEYSKIRSLIGTTYRIRKDSFDKFSNEEQFLSDVEESIVLEQFGPSFLKFKECLMYGNDFAIITARSHSVSTLKEGVRLLIDKTFSTFDRVQLWNNLGEEMISSYLNRQEYYGVSGEDFRKRFHTSVEDINPEENKKLAIEDYVSTVVNSSKQLIKEGIIKTVSVGFSDDDLGNISSVEKLINESLSKKYPEVTFVIYDTSNNSMNKRVLV
jgi:hypothetical protein